MLAKRMDVMLRIIKYSIHVNSLQCVQFPILHYPRNSRQEYWSGLPCPPSGDLPVQGIKSTSFRSPALAAGFNATCHVQNSA